MDFTKFPKIIHVPRALEEGLISAGELSATEKLDGANAGIVRTEDGLLLHSRNTVLAHLFADNFTDIPRYTGNGFNGFVDYVAERFWPIYNATEPGDHIFGEWLVPHTVTYPAEMYRKFYAFDAIWAHLPLEQVPQVATGYFTLDPQDPVFLEQVNSILNLYAEHVERPIEGVVFSVAGDSSEEGFNPYRDRFKLVLSQFKEAHKKAWTPTKAARAEGEIETALASYYPVRAYQKVTEKVRDLKGQLTTKETGVVLEMAWSDFVGEFLARALKKEKMPTINTAQLHSELNNRVRDLFLTQVQNGMLPVWAEHELRRAA